MLDRNLRLKGYLGVYVKHNGAEVEQKATCDIENEYENATYRFTQ